ncbi:MAG: YabP/YqfC family sporulation protein [bacterium]
MNIIRNNEITKNLLNDLKVTYQNNLIEITNYNKILIFDDKEIVLKNIVIQGENLKIIYIDKYQVKVNGTIHLVKGDINESEL